MTDSHIPWSVEERADSYPDQTYDVIFKDEKQGREHDLHRKMVLLARIVKGTAIGIVANKESRILALV